MSLLDLSTGAKQALSTAAGQPGPDGAGWSPDSRWLFLIDDRGRLVAIDARTRQARPVLPDALSPSPLLQLAVRIRSGVIAP